MRTSAELVSSDSLSHPEFIVRLIIAASIVHSPIITTTAAAAAAAAATAAATTTGMWKQQYPRQE